jgi:toxin CcdB
VAQFAVYKNKNSRTRSAFPYLVDVQSDLLESLQSRVVVPLTRAAALTKKPVSHLTPVMNFDGEPYLLMTPQLAGIARSELGAEAGALTDQRQTILGAIEFLLTGF